MTKNKQNQLWTGKESIFLFENPQLIFNISNRFLRLEGNSNLKPAIGVEHPSKEHNIEQQSLIAEKVKKYTCKSCKVAKK